jgi:hypothetical protein
MLSTTAIVGILIGVLVLWILLKLARVAIRLMLFFFAVLLILGAVYYVFMR